MRKNDIQINGSYIYGRQGWAYICNSTKYVVLQADMTEKDKEKSYRQFGKVRVAKKSLRGDKEIIVTGTFEVEGSRWMVGGSGCCITSSFGYCDMKELMENASAPVLRKDDIVAIAINMPDVEFAALYMCKVGSIDTNCMVMTEFIPLSEEEMEQLRVDAENWCNR